MAKKRNRTRETNGDREKDQMACHSLCVAVSRNMRDTVKALLKAGAPVDMLSVGGWAPVHYAARDNNAAMLELLLRYGADTETRTTQSNARGIDLTQYTALHIAAINGSTEAVACLLDAGADLDAKGAPVPVYGGQTRRETALDMANDQATKKLLQSRIERRARRVPTAVREM
jgi:ankyrin repeat protein